MEITDTNLVTLAEYLQKTLSPEVSLRKPGKSCIEDYWAIRSPKEELW
jgi:hypothetical protein